jgi:hypothetical protein
MLFLSFMFFLSQLFPTLICQKAHVAKEEVILATLQRQHGTKRNE